MAKEFTLEQALAAQPKAKEFSLDEALGRPAPVARSAPVATDPLGNVIGDGAEPEFEDNGPASFDLIKDLAKQFAAPIITAPLQVPRGAELGIRGLARQSMEGEPESLMPSSVFQRATSSFSLVTIPCSPMPSQPAHRMPVR